MSNWRDKEVEEVLNLLEPASYWQQREHINRMLTIRSIYWDVKMCLNVASPSFDLTSFPVINEVLPPCSKSNQPAPCATSKPINVTPPCLFHPGFMRRLLPLTRSEEIES